jgi:hypothetical protein
LHASASQRIDERRERRQARRRLGVEKLHRHRVFSSKECLTGVPIAVGPISNKHRPCMAGAGAGMGRLPGDSALTIQ